MPKFKAIPKTLGGLSDHLYQYREELRELKRKHDAEQKKYAEHIAKIEEEIWQQFAQDKIEGAKGKASQIFIQRTEVPTIEAENWPDVWNWIMQPRNAETRKQRLSIFQRRLNAKFVRELWEDGQKVDGVDKFIKKTIGCRKA